MEVIASTAAPTSLHPGAEIDGYRLLEPVQQGGAGLVYEAEHMQLGLKVCFRVLIDEARVHEARRPFDRVAKDLTRLAHPRIASVTDYGLIDGSPYLVMELLEGTSLAAKLSGGPLSIEEAVAYTLQLLEAFDHAHAKHVIHGDFCPSNVWLGDGRNEPQLKVLFLGCSMWEGIEVSRVFSKDERLARPLSYAAPEQLLGLPADERTDLYAMGVVLFEMLTGGLPFSGSHQDVVRGHLMGALPKLSEARPELARHPALQVLVERALRKVPEERFPSATSFAAALRELGMRRPLPRRTATTLRWDGSATPHPSSPGARTTFDLPEDLDVLAAPSLPSPHVMHTDSALPHAQAGLPLLPPDDFPTIPEQRAVGDLLSPAAHRSPQLESTTAAPRSPARPSSHHGLGWLDTLAVHLRRGFADLDAWRRSSTRWARIRTQSAASAALLREHLERLPRRVVLALAVGSMVVGLATLVGVAVSRGRSGDGAPGAALMPPSPAASPSAPSTTASALSGPAAHASTATSRRAPAAALPPAASAPARTVGQHAEHDPASAPVPAPPAGRPTAVLLADASAPGLTDDEFRALSDYARAHPTDAQPHLRMARAYLARNLYRGAQTRYEWAFRTDRNARNDPRMLPDLLGLVGRVRTSQRAAALVQLAYGRNALPALNEQLSKTDPTSYAGRRLRALRAKLDRR